jgi:hypothetical protein
MILVCIYKDDGAGTAVDIEVHYDLVKGKNYFTYLTVIELPAASLGSRFVFQLKAFIVYAIIGIASLPSDSLILTSLSDTPTSAPTRGVLTSESIVAIDFVEVANKNVASINYMKCRSCPWTGWRPC